MKKNKGYEHYEDEQWENKITKETHFDMTEAETFVYYNIFILKFTRTILYLQS